MKPRKQTLTRQQPFKIGRISISKSSTDGAFFLEKVFCGLRSRTTFTDVNKINDYYLGAVTPRDRTQKQKYLSGTRVSRLRALVTSCSKQEILVCSTKCVQKNVLRHNHYCWNYQRNVFHWVFFLKCMYCWNVFFTLKMFVLSLYFISYCKKEVQNFVCVRVLLIHAMKYECRSYGITDVTGDITFCFVF